MNCTHNWKTTLLERSVISRFEDYNRHPMRCRGVLFFLYRPSLVVLFLLFVLCRSSLIIFIWKYCSSYPCKLPASERLTYYKVWAFIEPILLTVYIYFVTKNRKCEIKIFSPLEIVQLIMFFYSLIMFVLICARNMPDYLEGGWDPLYLVLFFSYMLCTPISIGVNMLIHWFETNHWKREADTKISDSDFQDEETEGINEGTTFRLTVLNSDLHESESITATTVH